MRYYKKKKLQPIKRKSELELNEIRKTNYQILHLSRVLIVFLVALIFPLQLTLVF